MIDRFLAWCDERGLALNNITPGLAGEYMQSLEGSAPTKNQALAALRHFFDALVTRHAVPLNSFASVLGQKHSVVEGKTPEISIDQARKLLRSVKTGDVIGLRDRAVLGVLAYTGARIGAVAKLRNPASDSPSRSMIVRTSRRERDNRSSFQTTSTSPLRS